MDPCVSESTQMKGFITKITSVVGSSFVHRDEDFADLPSVASSSCRRALKQPPGVLDYPADLHL